MTNITKTILLTAALSTALTAGLVPAAARSETAADSETLITTKGDRGTHSTRLALILASIKAESDN